MGKHRGHGEGTIYERAKGGWCAQISLEGGKRKSFYGRTRQEVARKLAEATRDRDKGLPIPGERQTVEQYLTDWLKIKTHQIEPSTLERYQSHVRLHIVPSIGKRPLARLTPQHVQAMEAQLLATAGLAPRTVQHIHSTLKQALEHAARLSLVQRNVCALVDPPKAGRPERKFLTVEQAEAFLAALASRGDRLEGLFVLALNTALRQGELLALTWADVDLDGKWLHVRTSLQRYSGHKRIKAPKTDAGRRSIPLTQQALAALRAQRVRQVAERLKAGDQWEEHNLVFPNPWGKPANHRPVTDDHFKPALRRAGLPDIRFHDMRHTCASFLAHQGVNLKVVSQILGHSSISITMDVYTHLLPGDERSAADALERLHGW